MFKNIEENSMVYFVSFLVFVIVLIGCVIFANLFERSNFKNECFGHHGHIELFEDNRMECKYPLSMP